MFILKFAKSENLGHAPTNHYKPQLAPTHPSQPQYSVFYIPICPYPSRLPLPDVCFSIVYKSRTYCLTSATLGFTPSLPFPSHPLSSTLFSPYLLPFTPSAFILPYNKRRSSSRPATETCGLSLGLTDTVSPPRLLPAATNLRH